MPSMWNERSSAHHGFGHAREASETCRHSRHSKAKPADLGQYISACLSISKVAGFTLATHYLVQWILVMGHRMHCDICARRVALARWIGTCMAKVMSGHPCFGTFFGE